MVSLYVLCLLVILTAVPQDVVGVWKCNGTGAPAAKSNGTTSTGDCRPLGHNTTSKADSEILERALLLDPAAEHKYHVECKEPKAILEEAQAEQFHSRLTDLQDCKPEEETPRAPGIAMFQYGYNILTDSYTTDTAHTAILDIRSTTQFHATVLIGDKCYLLPDAFATRDSLGYNPHGFSTHIFDHIGANSTNSHREQEINSRKVEMSLGVTVPGVVTFGAAFSHSHTTAKLKEQQHSEGEDSSTLYFIEGPYSFTIQSALPTEEIIQVWKEVYRTKTKDAFYDYFKVYGTHYYLSGLVGGRLTATFSTKKSVQRTDNSNSDMRASCVSSKVSGAYMGVEAEASASYCDSAFKLDAEHATAQSLILKSKVKCDGGIEEICPTGLNQTEQFKEWRATIKEKPVLLKGSKRFIPQLIQHVLTRSGMGGAPGDVYKKVIARFAMTKKEDDLGVGPDEVKIANIANNSIPFQEFHILLQSYLTNYLTDNNYCNLSPDNCPSVHPIYWIEGISKSPWGNWEEEVMCPFGQFIKAFTRYIEMPYVEGDSGGLIKLDIRCGELRSDEVKTGVLSSGANRRGWGTPKVEEICLGVGSYLRGFRLWSQPNAPSLSKKGYDNRGATEIQFSCLKGGSYLNYMPAKPETTDGDYMSDEINCPHQHGICGIQSKVKIADNEAWDDSAVNNVRFACCHLGKD